MTFGTDPKYLVRTHDPDTSHEAAELILQNLKVWFMRL